MKFQRTKFRAYVKLGSRQKSMRKYRRPTGRHNKTRQKWKSRPPMVEIGYKNKVETRGLINNKTPIFVQNLADLDNVKKGNIIIINKIGVKNKLDLAKEIKKRNLEVYNINVNKFIKKMDKKLNKNKELTKSEVKK